MRVPSLSKEKTRSLGDYSSDKRTTGDGATAEEGANIHAFFAGNLDFQEAEGSIRSGYAEVLSAVAGYSAGSLCRGVGYRFGGVYLEILLITIGRAQDCPSSGIWGETADKIINLFGRLVPVYSAGFLEDFGCRTELIGRDLVLRNLSDVTCNDIIKGPDSQISPKFHELVMHGAGIVIGQDWNPGLMDYVAGINLMLKEKGGNSCLLVTVYDGPVDGGSSAILRQQGTVKIECTQRRHTPHYFGKHTEGYYNLKVGLKGSELFYE